METIFALASARGKAGIAVVRISGPLSFDVIGRLAGPVPTPRWASLRKIRNSNGDVLDEALIVTFQAGHSFTGEQSAELHLHGSPAIVAAVFDELGKFDGARAAEAGEFTRRALENNRLDLAQVEGLGDLVQAETEVQRRQAMRLFSGGLGERSETWRRRLIRAMALLEAVMDFSDDDVPEDVSAEVLELAESVRAQLVAEGSGVQAAERVREGFEVAIVGPPNVGKSTLLNYLAGREAAITSRHAGTTRDVIEVRMDIGGLPVTLLDTAGLREATDEIELIGIERTRERAGEADLRVFLVADDSSAPEMTVLPGDVVVVGKGDLYQGAAPCVSGISGAGAGELLARIHGALAERVGMVGVALNARHKAAMDRAAAELVAAIDEVGIGEERFDLGAEHLRRALLALDVLVGRVDVEHILDEIFVNFCIGK